MGTSERVSASSLTPSGGREWLIPLVGTAAGLAFAAAFSTALRIFRGFAKARDAAYDPPQAILVLGGDKNRELLAARFAASCGERAFTRLVKPAAHAASIRLLPVYVSSGYDDVASVMLAAGVHPSRLRIDNRALDTVTNFTTMLGTFLKAKISHVYLVTSDYHMTRASMLATLVLCSHGVAFTSVVIPSSRQGQQQGVTSAPRPVTSAESSAGPGRPPAASDVVRQRRLRGEEGASASGGTATSSTGPKDVEDAGRNSTSDAANVASPEVQAGSQLDGTSKSSLPRPSELARQKQNTPLESAQDAVTPSSQAADIIEAETWARMQRDRARAVLWLLTGWHGAELLRFTRPERYRLHKQKPLHPKLPLKKQ